MPQEKTPMVTLGISVPLQLRAKLLEESRTKYKSLSALCRDYLARGLLANKPKDQRA